MLKRFSHIAIAFIVLLSASGFNITQHYCKGSLVETTILNTPEHCCDNPGCCSYETHFVKLKDNFTPSSPAIDLTISQLDILISGFVLLNSEVQQDGFFRHFETQISPPPLHTRLALNACLLL